VDQHHFVGQQAGGEDRQGSVLVAGGGDLTRERDPTLDDEFFHGKRLQIEGFEAAAGPPAAHDRGRV
jgi:hypothetical protein